MSAFLTTYWKILVFGAVLGAVGLWLHHHDEDIRRTASTEAELGARKQIEKHLLEELASARTAVVHDSIVVTRYATKYATVRDSLRITDTVAVKEFVAVADSTVKSCSAFAVSCGQYRQWADSLLQTRASENDLLRRRVEQLQPSGFQSFLRRTLPIAAFVGGVVVGTRVTR